MTTTSNMANKASNTPKASNTARVATTSSKAIRHTPLLSPDLDMHPLKRDTANNNQDTNTKADTSLHQLAATRTVVPSSNISIRDSMILNIRDRATHKDNMTPTSLATAKKVPLTLTPPLESVVSVELLPAVSPVVSPDISLAADRLELSLV